MCLPTLAMSNPMLFERLMAILHSLATALLAEIGN
jgi:hypothetical protein